MENRQRWAIQRANEKRIKAICPEITTKSGIYLFYRTNEDNEKCVYVGQAKNLLQRTAQHLTVVKKETHIDKSLYAHKIYSDKNPDGWKVKVLEFAEPKYLDEVEKYYIDFYKDKSGFKIYNVTGGGQIDKAEDIGKRQPKKLKSYANGKKYGYEQARKEVAKLFEKNLTYSINGKENKNKLKAFEKFEKFLKE